MWQGVRQGEQPLLLTPMKGNPRLGMTRKIWISSVLLSAGVMLVLAPATALAGSPLLSGYGGPGAGEQAVIGSTLIGGSRGGGAGGSSGCGGWAGPGEASGSAGASTSPGGGASSTGSGSTRGSKLGSASGGSGSRGGASKRGRIRVAGRRRAPAVAQRTPTCTRPRRALSQAHRSFPAYRVALCSY